MQQFLYLKTEQFNKQILGINLPKLTQYQAGMVLMDKSAHAKEEHDEIIEAIAKFDNSDFSTYYDVIDGVVDLDYVLNGIDFINRRAQINIKTNPSYRTYRALINRVRIGLPFIPYMYAYNIVHRANMKKMQGRVAKRPFKYGFDAIKPFDWTSPDWNHFFKNHVLKPRPKIAILGYANAGKDTMGEIFRDWYGYSYTQATIFILENFLWVDYGLKDEYDTMDEAYIDRINHRKRWFDMICDINAKDSAAVSKAIFAKSDIYCGIRSLAELEGTYDTLDKIYWINCAKRIPIEEGSNEIHGDLLYKSDIFRKKLIVINNVESLFKFKINIYKHMESVYQIADSI